MPSKYFWTIKTFFAGIKFYYNLLDCISCWNVNAILGGLTFVGPPKFRLFYNLTNNLILEIVFFELINSRSCQYQFKLQKRNKPPLLSSENVNIKFKNCFILYFCFLSFLFNLFAEVKAKWYFHIRWCHVTEENNFFIETFFLHFFLQTNLPNSSFSYLDEIVNVVTGEDDAPPNSSSSSRFKIDILAVVVFSTFL